MLEFIPLLDKNSKVPLYVQLYQYIKQKIEEDKIPIPPKLKEFLSLNNLDFNDLVFYGGEEYNIVGTISEKNLVEISKILKMHYLKLYIIGKVVSGNGRVFVLNSNGNKKLLKNKGYTHFTWEGF